MTRKTSPLKAAKAANPYDMSRIPGSLREELVQQTTLFEAQPAAIQHFLEGQAQTLADALLGKASQARFKLPDEVALDSSGASAASIPVNAREQIAGRFLDGLTRSDLRTALRQRLLELEGSTDAGLATSATLIRHATASHLVHRVLPSGRAVLYATSDNEEIPSLPLGDTHEVDSAITAETDAIAESGTTEGARGELLVPYVPAARRFYLPQWVAFDDQGHLLLGSVQEAETHIASMQRFVFVLHTAIGLAPYIVADEQYQRKRYGILGQLANQARALARYQTAEIIETIRQRSQAGELNRGLSLSLPYFDDQDLEMKLHAFQVIPSGRIMFVPGFVARAAHEEQAKVAQDTRLSASTRKYLLVQLDLIARAFESPIER